MDLEANSFQHGHVGASCNASLQPKPRFPQQIRILFLCTHTARREEKEYQVHGVGNVRFVYGSGKPFYDDKPAVQTHCRKTIAQNLHDVVVAVIEENTLEDVDIGTGRHAFEISRLRSTRSLAKGRPGRCAPPRSPEYIPTRYLRQKDVQ